MSIISRDLFSMSVNDKLAFAPLKSVGNWWKLLTGQKSKQAMELSTKAMKMAAEGNAPMRELANRISALESNPNAQRKLSRINKLKQEYSSIADELEARSKKLAVLAGKAAEEERRVQYLTGLGALGVTGTGIALAKGLKKEETPWEKFQKRFK